MRDARPPRSLADGAGRGSKISSAAARWSFSWIFQLVRVLGEPECAIEYLPGGQDTGTRAPIGSRPIRRRIPMRLRGRDMIVVRLERDEAPSAGMGKGDGRRLRPHPGRPWALTGIAQHPALQHGCLLFDRLPPAHPGSTSGHGRFPPRTSSREAGCVAGRRARNAAISASIVIGIAPRGRRERPAH